MNRKQRRAAGYKPNTKELQITMGVSGEQVIINFSEMVHWIGLDLPHAEEFLANVQKNVDKLKMAALSPKRNQE